MSEPTSHYTLCSFEETGICDYDCADWPALAAGSRRAKTPKAVECEASQSGPKGNAQMTPNKQMKWEDSRER